MESIIFEHLLDPEFEDCLEAAPEALLNATVRTADWMDELRGVAPAAPLPGAGDRARQAFAAYAAEDAPPEVQAHHIMQLRAPEAVRHLVGMLSAYDWDFIEQAKEIRGYVVAKLIEETKSPDARIRLKALELTGKLTEIGSFTERIEITRKAEDTSVLEERIRARLAALLPPTLEIQDTEIKDIAVVKHAATAAEPPL